MEGQLTTLACSDTWDWTFYDSDSDGNNTADGTPGFDLRRGKITFYDYIMGSLNKVTFTT